MNLPGLNVVVWDAEIKNVIDGKIITWDTKDKMGISVACLFDFRTMDYMVYLDDNIAELLARLEDADLIVGFNINGFDIPLLEATMKAKLRDATKGKVYDLLDQSRIAVGYREGMRFPSGLKLDDHLLGTFGEENMKTAHGSQAPLMYQNGEMGTLISYCLADVKREAKLFKHVWDRKEVKTAMHGAKMLADPRSMLKIEQKQVELPLS